MPHKIFEADAFLEKANELKARFNKEAANTIFLTQGEDSANVPLDGLPFFVDKTWAVIRD